MTAKRKTGRKRGRPRKDAGAGVPVSSPRAAPPAETLEMFGDRIGAELRTGEPAAAVGTPAADIIGGALEAPGSSSTNADAAAAAIDAATAASAPVIPGTSSSSADPGSSSSSSSSSSSPAPAARADKWSKGRLRKASRKELIERASQLQDQIPQPESSSPAPASAADPLAFVDQTKQMLELTLPAIDETIVFLAGEAYRQKPAETVQLRETLAAPLAPHYDQLCKWFPWAPAIVSAIGIYTPKVFDAMRAERARKLEQAEPIATDPAPASENGSAAHTGPISSGPVSEFPLTRQWGGPSE